MQRRELERPELGVTYLALNWLDAISRGPLPCFAPPSLSFGLVVVSTVAAGA